MEGSLWQLEAGGVVGNAGQRDLEAKRTKDAVDVDDIAAAAVADAEEEIEAEIAGERLPLKKRVEQAALPDDEQAAGGSTANGGGAANGASQTPPEAKQAVSGEAEANTARGRRKMPTIYDVAKAAGVAPSTVSRAFSRPGRVNVETAQRIRKVAEELGYRAAPLPRPAINVRTRTIALVVSDITNPVYFDIMRGVQDAAADAGYTIMLLDSRESDVLERADIERILPAVEGVVLASSRMSDSTIRVLAKQKPTVIINRVVAEIPSVVPDNPRGMRRGLELLGAMGHEQVTYLSGPEASWADGMRWRAIREGAHELSMTVRRIGPLEPTVAGAVPAVLAWEERPTSAVFAYNDLLAVGFLRGVQMRGHRVPEDVSVVGFDNVFVADIVSPGLTTIATPRRALGVAAVRHLALGRHAPARHVPPTVLPVKLMERESVGAPRE